METVMAVIDARRRFFIETGGLYPYAIRSPADADGHARAASAVAPRRFPRTLCGCIRPRDLAATSGERPVQGGRVQGVLPWSDRFRRRVRGHRSAHGTDHRLVAVPGL